MFDRYLLQKCARLNFAKLGRQTKKYLPHTSEVTYLEDRISKGATLRGKCPICGQKSTFTLPVDFVDQLLALGVSREIIPPLPFLLRESLLCSVCSSSNRERQVAHVLLKLYEASSLDVLFDKHILYAESSGAMHNRFTKGRNYHFSEYFGSKYKPGEFVGDIRNEDFQNLSFDDESLDIVISRDVFEHIPDPYRAHREVFRVLKRGGRHIFTVPFSDDSITDIIRAEVVGGDIIHHLPAQYHMNPVDPENGALVFRIFSYESLVELKKIGFEPALWHVHEPDEGILGPNSRVFEAYKPE